jgi:limonene-1,2-epoxide hydrolase
MKPGKNQRVVERYIDAVNDNNRDRIVSFFADESVFENMQDQLLSGREAIWQAMAPLHQGAEQVDWQVDHLQELELGRVSTQGTVRYLKDGEWQEFEVNGVFKIKGSKIVHWH